MVAAKTLMSRVAAVIPATLDCNNDADHMGLQKGCQHLSIAGTLKKKWLAAKTIAAGVAASLQSVLGLNAHANISFVFVFPSIAVTIKQQQQISKSSNSKEEMRKRSSSRLRVQL